MNAENTYVNWYESRYLFLILSTLLFCILDAHLTTIILQHGGVEANPLMAILLQKNVALSLILKYVITALGLILLLVHKNFRIFGKFRVSKLIYVVFFIYFVLVITEVYVCSTLAGMNFGLIF